MTFKTHTHELDTQAVHILSTNTQLELFGEEEEAIVIIHHKHLVLSLMWHSDESPTSNKQ